VARSVAHRARPGLLTNGPFARLLCAQIVTQVGTQMNNTAGAWLLYRLTQSPLALGMEGLCFSAPMAVLPLVTGGLADRYDRVRLVRLALLAEAAQAFAVAGLAALGDLRAWMFYAGAVLGAVRLAVTIPAQSALLPAVVEPERLSGAVALSSATWTSSALLGPAGAGLLAAVAGPAAVFALNGVATVASWVTIRSLHLPPPVGPDGEPATAPRLGGMRYLRQHRRLLRLVLVTVVAMVGAIGMETLLPVFATKTWPVGVVGYGLLRAAPGVAAVVGGIILSARPNCLMEGAGPANRRLAACFVAAAACFGLFAGGPPLPVALAALTVGSLALTIALASATSEVQQSVPDRLRGRTGAVASMGQNGLAGLAAVGVAGAAAREGPAAAVTGLAVFVGATGAALSAAGRGRPEP